jgi:tRNA pseudouridine55 synthase
VDKPAAMTSHDVVQRVRRTLGTRSAGHTGTLDPFATGLLVVLIGRATRLARFTAGQPKTYLATARLGVRTDTDDLTGRTLETAHGVDAIPEARVRDELAFFLGTQLQQPPQFSAKSVAGERSYRRARRGETVELADVSVTVHWLELVDYQPPDVTFRATVSSGTYIRSLGRDLGQRLGVGAHLTQLRREAIGPLRVEEAVALDALSPAKVIPARRVVADLPQVELDDAAHEAVAHGRAVADPRAARLPDDGTEVALLHGGELVAMARADGGWLRPQVVLLAP